MADADDADRMSVALNLARGQLGRTGANPAVGCVIARDGQVVGEGATADGGRPHAEELALQAAGAAAEGATAYVTLEPCAARSSGGPSCAERLIGAGVARVVVALEGDPSPMAAGAGLRRLQAAGVATETGLMASEAAELYADYIRSLASGRDSR
jgi:diaminohydroxyphosphoribosylaminopyrimidine deaminase/5-amino-6-(5-phosphoribosylamino)uracil reductase